MLFFWTLIGGLTNRIRGGLFHLPSTTLGRLIHSIPFAIMLGLIFNSWWVFSLSAIGLFLGLLNGWGTFMDMGRTISTKDITDDPPIYWIVGEEDNTRPFWKRWIRDACGMALRGIWLFIPTTALLSFLVPIPWWSCLLGGAMPLFYEFDAQLSDRGYFEETDSWRKILGAELLMGIYTYGIWYWIGTSYA